MRPAAPFVAGLEPAKQGEVVVGQGTISNPLARTNGRAGPVRVLRRTMNIGRLDGAPIVL
jgi:hypothetical protein